jgi:peptidoglycan/LPS O-acetylase OafA/YrhL
MQINGIQFLRFIAVLLVVGSHVVLEIWRRMGDHGDFHYLHVAGGHGVDIFFVISGFVITISTLKMVGNGGAAAAWLFCKRRLIRIVPMYWLYTGLKAVLVIAVGSKAFSAGLAPGYLVSSLLFWPTTNPNGNHLPLLESGWTLSYEMLFYASFAVAIWRNWAPLRFSLLALGIVFLLGQIDDMPLALSFFGRTLLFEFLLGGMIARLWVRQVPVHQAVAPLLLLAASLLLFVFPMQHVDRLIGEGLPAAMLVASAVWLDRYAGVRRFAGYFKLLGDASYSIYLSHGLLVPVLVIVAQKVGIHNRVAVFLVGVAGALALGCVLYLCLEKPVTDWLNRRYTARKPVTVRATPA